MLQKSIHKKLNLPDSARHSRKSSPKNVTSVICNRSSLLLQGHQTNASQWVESLHRKLSLSSSCQINNVWGEKPGQDIAKFPVPPESGEGTQRTLGTAFWGIITLVSIAVPLQFPLEKTPTNCDCMMLRFPRLQLTVVDYTKQTVHRFILLVCC